MHSRPLRHGSCNRIRKPRAVATTSRTEPRQRANPAPWLRAFDHRLTSCTAAATPLRRPAVNLLAGLRLAGGYRVGCSTTPEATPLALSLPLSPSRQRRLLALPGIVAYCPPSAPPASLTAPSATSTPACSLCSIAPRPAGGKSQAIEHNSALPKMCQSLRMASLGGPSLRAIRVRVMVCYVLRPFAAHPAIQRVRAFTAWRKGFASLRAAAASLSGSPVAKAIAVPPAPTFTTN